MKKMILFAAAAAMFSTPAFAAPGDSATTSGAATAEVVAPISIVHDSATLDFGIFTTGTTGGTVVVTRGGAGSSTGEVHLLAASVESSDSFTVSGDADRRFSINTTGGTVVNGTTTMAFTTDARANQNLSSAGTATVKVGGTLTVAGNAPVGQYNGSYDITVAYN